MHRMIVKQQVSDKAIPTISYLCLIFICSIKRHIPQKLEAIIEMKVTFYQNVVIDTN